MKSQNDRLTHKPQKVQAGKLVYDPVQSSKLCNHYEYEPDFTGLARSVRCFRNNGHPNFQIVTLHIKQGVVERCDYSDPYASFELDDQLMKATIESSLNLNNNWKEGECFKK